MYLNRLALKVDRYLEILLITLMLIAYVLAHPKLVKGQ